MKHLTLLSSASKHLIQKRMILPILATVLLTAGVIAYRGAGPDHKSGYEFATVQRGDVVQRVFSTGTIHATMVIHVGSQVSGRVEKVLAGYNGNVRKGALLAIIDPRIFTAQLVQAEANLAAAKALWEKIELQRKESEQQLTRKRNLFEAGGVARIDLDAAETAYSSSCIEKKIQEARIAQLESAATMASISLEHTKITSPIDGVVLSRDIELGQLVAANPQPQSLFEIATDLRRLKIDIDVSEADVGGVKVGQTLSFRVDAYPARTFNGEVREIRPAPRFKQNTVYYTVIGHIDNSDLALRPGMTADSWIQTASVKNVLTIPAVAIREQKAKYYVRILDGKEVRQREVMIGIRGEGGAVEVLSGLREGERIVVQVRAK